MTRNRSVGLLLLAFFLGIMMGLGLGWQVWPVRWYDTDPADLRARHQEEWVMMAADSLAVNSNVDLAGDRLARLMDDDTGWEQVAALVQQVAEKQRKAGDGAAAKRLERMAAMAGLPEAGTIEFTPPRRTLVQSISWLGYVILGLGFLIMATALVVAVMARRRRANPAPSSVAVPSSAPNPGPEAQIGLTGRTSAGTVRLWGDDDYRGAARQELYPKDSGGAPPYSRADAYAAAAKPGRPMHVMPVYAEDEEEDEYLDEEEEMDPRHMAPTGATGVFLGTFGAEYVLGDDHFEVSYAIELGDELVGDCGIVIADVIDDEGVQRVDAFEVWLHDLGERGSQPEEVKCYLISEYASRVEAVRERLAARGPTYIARPNLSVTLETESLRMLITVTDMDYADDERMPNSYFSRLVLELRAEGTRLA